MNQAGKSGWFAQQVLKLKVADILPSHEYHVVTSAMLTQLGHSETKLHVVRLTQLAVVTLCNSCCARVARTTECNACQSHNLLQHHRQFVLSTLGLHSGHRTSRKPRYDHV
mmetsp:Transcript_45734/g.129399  ORF Transcript_45734/g.129399 Transcript_45734/m.129399 type:complete len:111 (+) Transcript_45734:149-481(+)